MNESRIYAVVGSVVMKCIDHCLHMP